MDKHYFTNDYLPKMHRIGKITGILGVFAPCSWLWPWPLAGSCAVGYLLHYRYHQLRFPLGH